MATAREKFVAAAGEIAGLGYAPETRDAYLALIAPKELEGPELSDQMGHMWSCALTVMGLWRKVGVSHPLLVKRYAIGDAMAWVSQIGKELGAEVYPGGTRVPLLGDAIEVNGGAHVIAAIVGVMPSMEGSVDSLYTVDTVEGGQVDPKGNKCITRYTNKKIAYVSGALYIGSARVLRWYDCEKLGIGDDAIETVDPAAG